LPRGIASKDQRQDAAALDASSALRAQEVAYDA